MAITLAVLNAVLAAPVTSIHDQSIDEQLTLRPRRLSPSIRPTFETPAIPEPSNILQEPDYPDNDDPVIGTAIPIITITLQKPFPTDDPTVEHSSEAVPTGHGSFVFSNTTASTGYTPAVHSGEAIPTGHGPVSYSHKTVPITYGAVLHPRQLFFPTSHHSAICSNKTTLTPTPTGYVSIVTVHSSEALFPTGHGPVSHSHKTVPTNQGPVVPSITSDPVPVRPVPEPVQISGPGPYIPAVVPIGVTSDPEPVHSKHQHHTMETKWL